MKHLILACAFLFSITNASYARNSKIPDDKSGTITGKVLDAALKQPLPYVNIIIKNGKDEVLTGVITAEDGSFKIEKLAEGKLIVSIQFMGYKTLRKEVTISKSNYNINLGNILLEEEAEGLDEVTVVAETSSIQQKVDRKVITIGKDLTTIGATASEIMNNLPSVSVDSQSGAISLRGNENVRVLVDGKPTNVPAAQLLKQIPSTSIKSIELITNPSAKYNPEGMSGIINIVLHKNSNVGFNGSFNVGLAQEINANFNSSADMNYRNGKFNFYGNYGNNIGKRRNYGFVNRLDDNTQQLFYGKDSNKSHLYKFGIDYYINDKNTFSVYTNQNIYNGKSNNIASVIFLSENEPDFRQDNFSDYGNDTETYNASFTHDFNKEGHKILLEADYSVFNSDETASFDFNTAPSYRDLVKNNRENTVLNLDYENPLKNDAKLELGLEYRNNISKNFYNTTSTSLYNSDYVYERSIYSFYATFGKTLNKWSYQVGARIEQYDVNADFEQDTQADATFTDEKFSIYPSTFLSYKTSEKGTIQASFSRRVDRPGLEQINPIREWSTPRITSVGNPELVQQFTNSYELNYTKQIKGGSITAAGFYRTIEDEISRAVYYDPQDPNGDRFILTYDNFDNNAAYGFEASSNYKPLKWWSFNASAEYFFKTVKGVVDNENIEVDNAVFNLRMSNNFTVTDKLSLSLFGMFRGPDEGLQFKRKTMTMVNTGLRYTFLNEQATFSFSYNDILNTMKFAFDGNRPYPSVGEFNWESNQWRIGFNYRFGGNKYRALSRKQRDDNEKSGSGGFL
ncbi:TonB-dependent receptor domain-containing protein [Mariniflexile aquimaris]|uniref:TonB-dependent receptor domain-containing protein n=1 Tax=Mariniflexile aquimaris TaxID=881009 RepID=A0ABW3BWN4_9FLAO